MGALRQMLFTYRKARMRSGPEGQISRWVGENYLDLKHHNPGSNERSIRIDIAKRRYRNGDFDPSGESDTNDFFLTNRVLESVDLNDLVVAFFRHEIGKEYENDEKKMRLMYSVIFEELIELGIPRNVAMQGQ